MYATRGDEAFFSRVFSLGAVSFISSCVVGGPSYPFSTISSKTVPRLRLLYLLCSPFAVSAARVTPATIGAALRIDFPALLAIFFAFSVSLLNLDEWLLLLLEEDDAPLCDFLGTLLPRALLGDLTLGSQLIGDLDLRLASDLYFRIEWELAVPFL